MSIEEALAANTAALIENTAAHARLADVAVAASGGKPAADKPADKPKAETPKDDGEKPETAAAKKKRLAAEKKAKEAAAAAEAEAAEEEAPGEAPELVAEVTAADLHTQASAFMSKELDAEVLDANKANFVGGLAHLGAKKFSELSDDSERARLSAYIGYWEAGLDVDFTAIDEAIEALGGDDDPMG